MKIPVNIMKRSFVLILLISRTALAAGTDLGLSGVQGWLVGIAMVAGPISFIIAGFMYYRDRQQGNEKLSAAVIGTVLIGAAPALFALFYGFANRG